MTERFDPRQHRFPERRYFDDFAVGERFYIPSRTMTRRISPPSKSSRATITRSITMSNIAASAATRGCWRTASRSLCFTAAWASSFALAIGDALIAFTEQSSKFLKPVYPGDTLYPMIEITALTPQRSTGAVTLAATVHSQRGELVLSGEPKILLRKRRSEVSGAR